MARIYLNFDGKNWNKVEKSDFWLDIKLYEKLLNLKKIQKKAWDGVIIIDGMERSGKSTLGMACGWFLSDCKLTAYNFAIGLPDAAAKIAELPDDSVLIFDEGSTIFSSKDSSMAQQKKLMKILDVVGQKRLLFIICLPCVFDLNKTIAVRRSKFLLHVYPNEEYDRGQYAFWGEKDKGKLYRIGKKNFDSYAFPHSEFVGEYPDFKPHFYEEYLNKIKKESLKQVLLDASEDVQKEYKLMNWRIKMVGRINEFLPQLSEVQIGKILELTAQSVNGYLKVYKKGKEVEKTIENKENFWTATKIQEIQPLILKPLKKKEIFTEVNQANQPQ